MNCLSDPHQRHHNPDSVRQCSLYPHQCTDGQYRRVRSVLPLFLLSGGIADRKARMRNRSAAKASPRAKPSVFIAIYCRGISGRLGGATGVSRAGRTASRRQQARPGRSGICEVSAVSGGAIVTFGIAISAFQNQRQFCMVATQAARCRRPPSLNNTGKRAPRVS